MNALTLAERVAEGAIANYGRDGHLSPIVLGFDDDGANKAAVLVQITPENGGAPPAAGAATMLLGAVWGCRYVVMVSETWTKSFADDERLDRLERGHLEGLAQDGDTSVHTALLIAAFDLEDLDASHTLMYDVDDHMRRTDMPGLHQGAIADEVASAARRVKMVAGVRPDDYTPSEEFIQELIASASLGRWVVAIAAPQETP